jgi:metal-responsive CopG/Arc/MetJ family transcriptional regulator
MQSLGKNKVTAFNISTDILDKIDKSRGYESRSRFVNRLLSASLNKEATE